MPLFQYFYYFNHFIKIVFCQNCFKWSSLSKLFKLLIHCHNIEYWAHQVLNKYIMILILIYFFQILFILYYKYKIVNFLRAGSLSSVYSAYTCYYSYLRIPIASYCLIDCLGRRICLMVFSLLKQSSISIDLQRVPVLEISTFLQITCCLCSQN